MAAGARDTQLVRVADHFIGRFHAMASPCEVLIDTDREADARAVLDVVAGCAWRIEGKYSRYRDDNIVHAINAAQGKPLEVDAETADLIDFARTLYELSAGLFDITSGILRRAWRFDGGQQVPDPQAIAELLKLVGWNKVTWQRPSLCLHPGMQLDFGGIGKEFAVDQAVALARDLIPGSCLVNFGGDLALTRPRLNGTPWHVGIEAAATSAGTAARLINLYSGALATSGDTHRFVVRDGRRYTHILDPRNGWPVADAPHSITVAADSCTQAGMLTTLAMLRGADAERFLENEGVRYWVQR